MQLPHERPQNPNPNPMNPNPNPNPLSLSLQFASAWPMRQSRKTLTLTLFRFPSSLQFPSAWPVKVRACSFFGNGGLEGYTQHQGGRSLRHTCTEATLKLHGQRDIQHMTISKTVRSNTPTSIFAKFWSSEIRLGVQLDTTLAIIIPFLDTIVAGFGACSSFSYTPVETVSLLSCKYRNHVQVQRCPHNCKGDTVTVFLHTQHKQTHLFLLYFHTCCSRTSCTVASSCSSA